MLNLLYPPGTNRNLTIMDATRSALERPAVRRGGRYVLYWCRWNRRVESNHALLYAAETGQSA